MNAKTLYLATCVSICLVAAAFAAPKKSTTRQKQSVEVATIDLFEAIEQGTIESSVIPRDSHAATVFLANKSDAPLRVKFPPAVVAVQVLKQGFAQRGNNTPGNGFPQGNGAAGGAAQPLGGGAMNGNGNGNGNQQGIFNQGNNNGPFNGNNIGVGNGFPMIRNNIGFFSVPAHKTVQVPLTTVCLAHGKPDPRPRMQYQLVKLEDYTNDPLLQETLKSFVAGGADVETAQAAAWHLSDNMSWADLKAKQIEHLGGVPPTPYFTESKVDAAEEFINQVREKVKDLPRQAETAAR
jgi:hypothetical protein